VSDYFDGPLANYEIAAGKRMSKGTFFRNRYGEYRVVWTVLCVVLAVATLVTVVLTGCMFINNHDTHVQCLRVSEETGLETKTVGHFQPSCYIKVGGHWVPQSTWINNRQSN